MTTHEAIEESLTKFPKARRIAVENFVSSCPSENGMHNAMNLHSDARSYGWKPVTVDAIRHAMRLAGKPI
jgi:hypothetical protein